MSMPPAGNYCILNRASMASGRPIAITFNGEGQYVSVTPFDRNNTRQQWAIIDFRGGTQSVSPTSNHNIQIGWGAHGAIVLQNHDYVWNIRGDPSGVTIRDGGNTAFWGLGDAGVSITAGNSPRPDQIWILYHI